MLLYTTHITPRLSYIVDFVSTELFADPIEMTTDRLRFIAYAGPKINYSESELSGSGVSGAGLSEAAVSGSGVSAGEEFFIRSTPLLFETGIRPQVIECFELNFHKAFFATEGDLLFDVFAASFYLLSRYEEYLPGVHLDEYGRFAHVGSLAFREGFLDMPLVNIWMQELKKALAQKWSSIAFRYPSFKFIPTYDIDIAWSYLHKGVVRNAGGLARSVVRGEVKEAVERLRVLRGAQADPYDAYEWLDSLHLYCRMRAYYFFLVPARQKGYDKNIPIDRPAFQDLVRYHAAGYRVGVHPSWQSGDDDRLLKEEIEWMELMTESRVMRSRQHYIRFTLPVTYRRLIANGIEQDFSMGYGSINGFRASVASSFYWYDLEREEKTSLRLFPFCFMDANSYYEQKYTAAQAMSELLHYYHIIRRLNGLMITIWHNSFLGTDPRFAGWREVYGIFLKEEVYWDA